MGSECSGVGGMCYGTDYCVDVGVGGLFGGKVCWVGWMGCDGIVGVGCGRVGSGGSGGFVEVVYGRWGVILGVMWKERGG